MKICPMGAELFHVDRRTDMMKLIVAIRNFADMPKSYISYKYVLISLILKLFYLDARETTKINYGVDTRGENKK
jgi:hypothetical protein